MEKSSKCSKLLPYHIIAAAASGDVEAINEVLKHYDPVNLNDGARPMWAE